MRSRYQTPLCRLTEEVSKHLQVRLSRAKERPRSLCSFRPCLAVVFFLDFLVFFT